MDEIPATAEPMLTLFSDGLLSKWGFNDGDAPDQVLDRCDELGIPYPDNWHEVLYKLVVERLIPVLDQSVQVVRVETIHNPVRAEKVDGVDVVDSWYDDKARTTLTPSSIQVPMADVISTCLQPDLSSQPGGETP